MFVEGLYRGKFTFSYEKQIQKPQLGIRSGDILGRRRVCYLLCQPLVGETNVFRRYLSIVDALWNTSELCFNCKRRSGRVIRLRSPRSRRRATSEVKRILSKMRSFFFFFFFFHCALLLRRSEGCYRRLCTNATVVLHSSSAFSSQRIMTPLKVSRPFTLEPLEIRRYSTSHTSRPDAVHLLYRSVCTFE